MWDALVYSSVMYEIDLVMASIPSLPSLYTVSSIYGLIILGRRRSVSALNSVMEMLGMRAGAGAWRFI